jgi:hypothetical protein
MVGRGGRSGVTSLSNAEDGVELVLWADRKGGRDIHFQSTTRITSLIKHHFTSPQHSSQAFTIKPQPLNVTLALTNMHALPASKLPPNTQSPTKPL